MLSDLSGVGEIGLAPNRPSHISFNEKGLRIF